MNVALPDAFSIINCTPKGEINTMLFGHQRLVLHAVLDGIACTKNSVSGTEIENRHSL